MNELEQVLLLRILVEGQNAQLYSTESEKHLARRWYYSRLLENLRSNLNSERVINDIRNKLENSQEVFDFVERVVQMFIHTHRARQQYYSNHTVDIDEIFDTGTWFVAWTDYFDYSEELRRHSRLWNEGYNILIGQAFGESYVRYARRLLECYDRVKDGNWDITVDGLLELNKVPYSENRNW